MADGKEASIGSKLRSWSLVHKVADVAQQREVDKLCEVLKHFTKDQARQLVADARGSPVLCSYSNDGTPMRSQARHTTTGTMGPVQRVGKKSHELLVQRAVYRSRGSTGGWKTSMQVRDPLSLVHGKGADAIFSASVEFLKTLRELGHGGIAVQHYAFDRALHAPLVRRFKQHHALLASEGKDSATNAVGAQKLFQPAFLEWIVDTACVNHDCHNALKWGLFDWLTDEKLMKDVFLVIESIRNAHSQLEAELGRWIARVVHWADDEELMSPLEAAALWSALGVEPKWVDHLVDLGLVWRDGRLLVNKKHQGKVDVWADILNAVRHAMKFKEFSDSRWCTIGRCCRQILHSLLLGLRSLMDAVLRDPNTSKYLIGGYRLLSPDVLHFISVAAFASTPSEGLLAELLQDDRLCLHYQAYQDRLRDEFSSIVALPDLVWEQMSGLDSSGKHTASSLRTEHSCTHTTQLFPSTRNGFISN